MAKMKKRHYEGGRAMHEPSERGMEYESGRMLSEDHNAIANMPQMVKYHKWSGERPYLDMSLDDTITGIERQQSEDVNMAKRHKAKSMY